MIKAQAQAMLLNGDSLKEVMEATGLKQSTVSRLKQELKKQELNEDVDKVSNLDPKTVLALADNLKHTQPCLARNLVHLSEGLESMNKLEPVIHNALGDLVVMTQRRLAKPNLKNAEFKMLGELLIKTYATMYNRPAVEINMTQTKVVQTAVTERLNNLTRGIFEPIIEGES